MLMFYCKPDGWAGAVCQAVEVAAGVAIPLGQTTNTDGSRRCIWSRTEWTCVRCALLQHRSSRSIAGRTGRGQAWVPNLTGCSPAAFVSTLVPNFFSGNHFPAKKRQKECVLAPCFLEIVHWGTLGSCCWY